MIVKQLSKNLLKVKKINFDRLKSEDFLFLGYCPTVFDGWSCINSTLAGETAEFPCPPFDNFNYNEKSKFSHPFWGQQAAGEDAHFALQNFILILAAPLLS